MEWHDDGIVLASRPFGEGGAIVSLLTASRGRHAGLVRGAARQRAALEPGTAVAAVWKGRTADQLGQFTLEPEAGVLGRLIDEPVRLTAVQAAAALAEAALPEREPQPAVFQGLGFVIRTLCDLATPMDVWAPVLIAWERGLLAALGFGLDLSRCAATGAETDLIYVSPRTGRAVSRSTGAPWRERLLPLPGFLAPRAADRVDQDARGQDARGQDVQVQDIVDGFRLTGYFLERHALAAIDNPLPPARDRLVRLIEVQAGMLDPAPDPDTPQDRPE